MGKWRIDGQVTERQLEMWTVYQHPRDYPDKYVARKWTVTPKPIATNDMFTADSLGEVRRLLPAGLHCLARLEHDDPAIVEIWL